MSSVRVEHDGTSPQPPLGGSLAYLLMNMPLGIVWFTLVLTVTTVGVSTMIIWVGLPIAALAVLLWRGGAQIERARTYALLDTYIPQPYRPLPPEGQAARWKARMRDTATWRDVTYLGLLLPLGIVQFTVVVTFWSTSLALAGLPIYYRFLPSGAYHFPSYNVRWISVDSALEALPWAALGVLCIALSVKLTRALAAAHARFARSLLGPTASLTSKVEDYPAPFGQATPRQPVAG